MSCRRFRRRACSNTRCCRRRAPPMPGWVIVRSSGRGGAQSRDESQTDPAGPRRRRARRCVRHAAPRRDRHAGRARHRRRRRGPHGRARADGAGRLRARARGARPHRRPRLHREQPGRHLGSRLLVAAFLERQPVDGLRAPERLRDPGGRLPAPRLRRCAPHGRVRDRGLSRRHRAHGARARQGRAPRPRHSRRGGIHPGDARRSLVCAGHGRPHRLGGCRAVELLRARFLAIRRGRRGLRDPARLRHAARALREIGGRQPQHAGDAHPLGRPRRRRGHRRGSRHCARRRRGAAVRGRRRGRGRVHAAPAGRGAAGAPRPAARDPRQDRVALQEERVPVGGYRSPCR